MTTARAREAWMYPAAILLAAFIAWVDLRLEELLLTAVLTLTFSMLSGTAQPARPWRWAVIFGLAVPVAHLLVRAIGWMWVDPARLPVALALLIVSFVGAYAGAFFRRTVANLTSGG